MQSHKKMLQSVPGLHNQEPNLNVPHTGKHKLGKVKTLNTECHGINKEAQVSL